MTAFPNQANVHNQNSGQTHAPVPSSFPPTNFMAPPGVVANKNKAPTSVFNNKTSFPSRNSNELSNVKPQPSSNMKASQILSQSRKAPASIPSSTNTSHMMPPTAQQLSAPIPPQNMKSQFPPPMSQIMHKPNMPNLHITKMNVPPTVTASSVPPTPLPSSLLPTPTAPAPVPVSKSKSSKKSKKNNSNHSNQNANVGAHGENTGRWTQEEHRLFLEGLEKHGKGWKKIASLIKSRTVVQIRTHAQKYFQKLAKARHNGEEGDVSMEGRGVGIHCGSGPGMAGGMSIPPLSSEQLKRRRNSCAAGGTKRKTLETVVTSARREGKRLKEVNDPLVMPSISPCLAPFVMHPGNPNGQPMPPHNGTNEMMPSGAPTLEDSLYRFLTPMSADYSIQPPRPNQHPAPSSSQQIGMKQQINDPNNPNQFIVLPNSNELQFSEGSPTCVTEIPNFPSFPNNKLTSVPAPPGLPNQEAPHWYARGADVDELLHDADALNWLADSGDIDEPFHEFSPNPVPMSNSEVVSLSESEGGSSNFNNNTADNNRNLATDALPPVISSTSTEDIHGLPSLFDSNVGSKSRMKLSTPNLFSSGSAGHPSTGNLVDENFSVFDSAMDEQAFVSALLENNENAVLSVSSDM